MSRSSTHARAAIRLMLSAGLLSAGDGLALANPCAPKSRDGMMQKNPAAMKKAGDMMKGGAPCNPCAAKKKAASPCNPCAAKNPCAARKKTTNPCNPCAAKKVDKHSGLTPAQAKKAYAALLPTLRKAYVGGAHPVSDGRWATWKNFAKAPYIGATHGGRWLTNYANPTAAKVYGQYEKLKSMPAGGIIAKPSMVMNDGKPTPGPLFIMEKMKKGWNPATMDWRYAMILPGGMTFGITGGMNADKVAFCHECHVGARENDALFFLPEDVRVN